MGFTYGFGTNPQIDYIRLLIADTVESTGSPAVRAYIFDDQEILMAYNIQSSTFQSGMFYTGNGTGATIPGPPPTTYWRAAAVLLDALSSSKSRLASLVQVLDVKLDPSKTAKTLRDQADHYRGVDDNSGAFVIIEQVRDPWTFRERFWKEIQRQQGLGFN